MNIFYIAFVSYLGFTVGPARVEKNMVGAETVTEIFDQFSIEKNKQIDIQIDRKSKA